MIGYINIQKVYIPKKSIEEVYVHIRSAGEKGVEGVALFAGQKNNSIFEIKTALIPRQKAFNHEGGLLYTVDGEELHRINVWLYKNKLSIIAQIHSHPSKAYHSDTDDKYPIVTTIGGISIVVPDFGFGQISVSAWAVYRLNTNRIWIEQSFREVNSLITII